MNFRTLYLAYARMMKKTQKFSSANKQGYLLLECMTGLLITMIVIGYVFQSAVHLSHECKNMSRCMMDMYGLFSVCDVFEQDLVRSWPIHFLQTNQHEIMWTDGHQTVAWIVTPEALRRKVGVFETTSNTWKKAATTIVSRSIKNVSLQDTVDGYRLRVSHINGGYVERHIGKRV